MRTLNIGTRKYTEVKVLDERGQGNANHHYQILSADEGPGTPRAMFCEVNFQNGPIKEAGVNGVHNEDLLAIVLDRLVGFQSGRYNCSENSKAIVAIREAMCCLNDRTKERERRGVEGTNTIYRQGKTV